MDSNIWQAIPHGKDDLPRLLFDPRQPQSYDFNDPDSQFVMFNRELAGFFTLPFSKPMRTDLPGRAVAGGRAISARVVPLRLATTRGTLPTRRWRGRPRRTASLCSKTTGVCCRCPAARMTPIRNHWKPLSETAGYPWGSCSKMCAVWWRDCCGCKKEDFK